MTALDKYNEQIRIARETGNFVVQTADEAQAVVTEIAAQLPAGAHLRCERCGTERTIQFSYSKVGNVPDR